MNLREWNMSIRTRPPVVADTRVLSLAAADMEGAQDKSVARVSLRERRESTPSIRYPVIAQTWKARFSFNCPSPNLPKIITIYASTSLREFQELRACGQAAFEARLKGYDKTRTFDPWCLMKSGTR